MEVYTDIFKLFKTLEQIRNLMTSLMIDPWSGDDWCFVTFLIALCNIFITTGQTHVNAINSNKQTRLPAIHLTMFLHMFTKHKFSLQLKKHQ